MSVSGRGDGISAVSYTHLDVYKRQVYSKYLTKVVVETFIKQYAELLTFVYIQMILFLRRQQEYKHDFNELDLLAEQWGACLLYTSRCV